MTQFLFETLLWTGVLIAVVLLLRRPVAKHLGPQAAYALWLLPALRLIMPPLVLPAWLKPEVTPAQPVEAAAAEPVTLNTEVLVTVTEAGTPAEAVNITPLEPTVAATPSFWDSIELPSLADIAVPVAAMWLAGATVFLIRRFALYYAMRRELLSDSYAVGQSGKVRLVETPSVNGPVAFGVIDKVVALPIDFMISRDRVARDLALEHELAHHRGQDLLVNILVQPLFALHWFNPLGWAGWRALRRDQEAACDARVLASRPKSDRATYAGIIAELATTANGNARLALAAPMACPVLGDKSIIHRLRSISMSDLSQRRKFAGRALLAGGALALPLTASISYATAPTPPAPPAPPTVSVAPPAPPAPLAPPAPPVPLMMQAGQDVDVDVDAETIEEVERQLDEMEEELERAEQELEREIEREMEREERRVVRIRRNADQARNDAEKRRQEVIIERERYDEIAKEARRDARMSISKMRRELAEDGQFRKEMRLALSKARSERPQVVVECLDDRTQIAKSKTSEDGQTTIFLCKAAIEKTARESIGHARKAIELDRTLSKREKAEALRSIDEAMEDLDDSLSEMDEEIAEISVTT